jgi:hypothetical protein
MEVKKVIIDSLPQRPNECIFWKAGFFLGKCRILKKSDWEVCLTDKCPLQENKEKE